MDPARIRRGEPRARPRRMRRADGLGVREWVGRVVKDGRSTERTDWVMCSAVWVPSEAAWEAASRGDGPSGGY